MTRRIISRRNSLVDGRPASKRLWDNLHFSQVRIDHGPSPAGNPGPYLIVPERDEDVAHRVYPRYQVGDTIWGKETFATANGEFQPMSFIYRADNKENYDQFVWSPSIFMPKWACRINLEILEVKPERIQDITEEDASEEGCSPYVEVDGRFWNEGKRRLAFKNLWNSLHSEAGKRWEDNPFTWVIRFKRL